MKIMHEYKIAVHSTGEEAIAETFLKLGYNQDTDITIDNHRYLRFGRGPLKGKLLGPTVRVDITEIYPKIYLKSLTSKPFEQLNNEISEGS